MIRRRLASILGTVSLLVLGAVLGIAADRHLQRGHDPVTVVAMSHDGAIEYFRERFDLDEDQVRRIHEVFLRHQTSVDSLWRVVRPHMTTAIDSVHAELEAILRPAQRDAFMAWLRSDGPATLHRQQLERH